MKDERLAGIRVYSSLSDRVKNLSSFRMHGKAVEVFNLRMSTILWTHFHFLKITLIAVWGLDLRGQVRPVMRLL